MEVDKGLITIMQKFENHAEKVGYAFGLLTPDDACTSNGLRIASDTGHFPTQKAQLIARARQNVILVKGFFMGKLGKYRVCCLWKEGVGEPSDMRGLLFVKFKSDLNEIKYDISQKLIKAGYKLET